MEASKNGSERLVTEKLFSQTIAEVKKEIAQIKRDCANLVNNQTQMDLRQDRTDNTLGEFRTMVETKLIELFSGLEAASEMFDSITNPSEEDEGAEEYEEGNESNSEAEPVTYPEDEDEDWRHDLLYVGEEVPPPPGADTNEEGDIE